MSAFDRASPAQRYIISETAAKRFAEQNKNAPFDWKAFAAFREQVAQEMEAAAKPIIVKPIDYLA